MYFIFSVVNSNINQIDGKGHQEKINRGRSDNEQSGDGQGDNGLSDSRQSKNGQNERIRRVRYFCTHGSFVTQEKHDFLSTGLIYAEQYRLAYINIPKIGSTFLKKLFYVLKFGTKNAHKIIDRMRSEVHSMTRKLITQLNSSDFDHMTTLITARNPYTRLFSAYVDKVYLPLSKGLRKAILAEKHMTMLNKQEGNTSLKNTTIVKGDPTVHRHQQLVCTTNISFQDFLNFVLTGRLRGKAMYDHYGPVSLLMSNSICSLKHLLIIKQETFAADVEYVLKLIKVDDNIYRLVHNQLHKDYAKQTISSIVETTYTQIRTQTDISKTPHCWTMPVIAERLWKLFQAQGVIDEKSHFPAHRFSEKAFHDSGYLIKVILNEIQARPMSEERRREQRQRTMLAAYKGIRNETFKRIRGVFSEDFQMFDYNKFIF